MSTYFISPDGQNQEGPLSLDEIHARFAAGHLPPGTLAWREGLANWSPIADIPELRDLLLAPQVAPQPAAQPATYAPPEAVPQPVQPFRTFAPPQQPGPLVNPLQAGQPDGLAIASLILGCISIVSSCAQLCSLPFSITGIALGCMSKTKTGVRTAGIITSSIGLGLAIVWLIVGVLASLAGKP